MKSILYVGATLMIGASIFGFVDYNKSRNNKEFNNMYAEKESADPVISPENKVNGQTGKKEVASKVKKTAVKKQVAENVAEKIIEPDIPVTKDEIMITKEFKIENTDVTVVPVKEVPSEKIVKKKKRKLNAKLFSRGALDERYLDEEKLKPEVPKSKKEAGKTEIKEKI
jgi:hypothetical protein